MHALPFDWRKGVLFGGFNDIMDNLLKKSMEITGKKAIITAHSLGTVNSLYYFSQTS